MLFGSPLASPPPAGARRSEGGRTRQRLSRRAPPPGRWVAPVGAAGAGAKKAAACVPASGGGRLWSGCPSPLSLCTAGNGEGGGDPARKLQRRPPPEEEGRPPLSPPSQADPNPIQAGGPLQGKRTKSPEEAQKETARKALSQPPQLFFAASPAGKHRLERRRRRRKKIPGRKAGRDKRGPPESRGGGSLKSPPGSAPGAAWHAPSWTWRRPSGRAARRIPGRAVGSLAGDPVRQAEARSRPPEGSFARSGAACAPPLPGASARGEHRPGWYHFSGQSWVGGVRVSVPVPPPPSQTPS